MPNPGTMTSLQTFDRECLNNVIHIPDYSLRRQLAIAHREALIVEAFTAFDAFFHLQLRWTSGRNFPDLQLTSATWHCQKVVLDINIQSPHFSHTGGFGIWSSDTIPYEVNRAGLVVPLKVNQPPATQNDSHIGLEQMVTFTIVGTLWRLDDSAITALHCKSFREHAHDVASGRRVGATTLMVQNHLAMLGAEDGKMDVRIELLMDPQDSSCSSTIVEGDAGGDQTAISFDDDAATSMSKPGSSGRSPTPAVLPPSTRMVHSFVLQAQSPVFRRMLTGPMTEATEGVIKISGMGPIELDDFLRALYGLAVPSDVYEDTDRLLSLLAIADRYGVVSLRDDCAVALEGRLSEENMGTLLKVADMHQASGLRAAALQFIARRADWMVAVMDTDDASVRRSVREHLRVVEMAKRKVHDIDDSPHDGVEITV